MKYDMIVLGGGPGGHAGALEAARCGLKTALVEREHLGGTCLNVGCIPTKLFLGATAAIAELEAQARLKLAKVEPEGGRIAIDLPALQVRKERMLAGSRQAVAKDLEQAGVDLVRGNGRLAGPGALEVEGEEGTRTLEFHKLMLATGSRPSAWPTLPTDGQVLLNSDHALSLDKAPESLLVIGAGAIGLEMAEFFHRLGAHITVVEALDRLAPTEDPEICKVMATAFKRKGWTIEVGSKVASLEARDGRAQLRLESGKEYSAEKALVAAGRWPNSKDMGLEQAGVELLGGAGWVKTDGNLMAAKTIYAIGDVNGRHLLAHAASHQARYAARHAAGRESGSYDAGAVPYCMYGTVEGMRVGPTAAELARAGESVEVSRSQLAANAISQSHGSTHGQVKVAWVGGKVRGVCAVGHGVSHLATQAVLAVGQGWTVEDAHRLIWAHPTLDEALEAALTAPREPA